MRCSDFVNWLGLAVQKIPGKISQDIGINVGNFDGICAEPLQRCHAVLATLILQSLRISVVYLPAILAYPSQSISEVSGAVIFVLLLKTIGAIPNEIQVQILSRVI